MIYNVCVSIVELVEADSPKQAEEKLCASLKKRGYVVYAVGDTFESDTTTEEGILR